MITSKEAAEGVAPYLSFERSEGWTMNADGELVWAHVAAAPELELPKDQGGQIRLDELGLSVMGTALAQRMGSDHARILAV